MVKRIIMTPLRKQAHAAEVERKQIALSGDATAYLWATRHEIRSDVSLPRDFAVAKYLEIGHCHMGQTVRMEGHPNVKLRVRSAISNKMGEVFVGVGLLGNPSSALRWIPWQQLSPW